VLDKESAAIFHEMIEQVGECITHTDGIDPDAVFDGLQCLCSCELGKRALGGGIGCNAGKGKVCGIGGDIHNGAGFALHHFLVCFTREKESAGDIGLHLPVPVLFCHLDDGFVENATGIIDQYVQLAESGQCQLDRFFR